MIKIQYNMKEISVSKHALHFVGLSRQSTDGEMDDV